MESWVTRDHAAEWKQWVARCDYIADGVSKIPGVTTTVQREPAADLSNRTPRVTIRWESTRLGVTGAEVAQLLYNSEPRIALNASRGGGQAQEAQGDTGISISSSMMAPGDEKVVAQRIAAVLSAKQTLTATEPPAAPATNLSGRWGVEIQYAASGATHTLHLQQSGNRLEGTHQGEFLARDIAGSINGDVISLESVVTERHGDALTYRFSGKVTGETMSGALDMGEYLNATWTAQRYYSSRR